jgi:hypothetical protein
MPHQLGYFVLETSIQLFQENVYYENPEAKLLLRAQYPHHHPYHVTAVARTGTVLYPGGSRRCAHVCLCPALLTSTPGDFCPLQFALTLNPYLLCVL